MPFATVLLISFGLHALIGWSLAADLSAFAAGAPGALWALLVLSALLLPAGFVLRRQARATWARALHALGFTFMGLFSSLFVLALLRELALLPAGLVHLVWPQTLDLAAWRSHSALVTVLLALAATAWGYLNARRTASVVRIDIPVAGLPDALHGFSMAQISDIHVGPTIRRAIICKRIVARVNLPGGRPGGHHRRPGRRQRARAVGAPPSSLADINARPTAPSSSPATMSITRVSHAWVVVLRRLGVTGADERTCGDPPPPRCTGPGAGDAGGGRRHRLRCAPFRREPPQRSPPGTGRRALAGGVPPAAGAPATQRTDGGCRGFRPAAVGAHPRRAASARKS
jgi:hypothetical protein